jgi:hypothetical protein
MYKLNHWLAEAACGAQVSADEAEEGNSSTDIVLSLGNKARTNSL